MFRVPQLWDDWPLTVVVVVVVVVVQESLYYVAVGILVTFRYSLDRKFKSISIIIPDHPGSSRMEKCVDQNAREETMHAQLTTRRGGSAIEF